jgi:uncharacterized membrane-anchored protein
MTASRKLLLAALAIALVQIGILSWMIAGRAMILRSGREVVLEVQPVDPRDLLRGDYVRLGYNISTLPAELFGAGMEAEPEAMAGGLVVFVRLRPDAAGIWQPVAAAYGAPPPAAPQPGDVDMRGVAEYWPGPSAQRLSVDYGIERFYLPEGQGRPIEDAMRERKFRMKVAVAGDGTAQIKAFYDGDTLIYSEPLY